MSRPLKILILGRDPDMFASPGGAPNDTRERHIAYVRELQRRRPGSEVRIIVHTWRPGGGTFDAPIEAMNIYGTYSSSRIQCPIDMARLVLRFRKTHWIPDLISCQTGYEEGLIALATANSRSRIEIQMHSDYYGSAFARRSVLRKVQKAVLRSTVRRSDHVRAVSRGIKESIARCGDISPERISVAPVPISFVPAFPPSLRNQPTVLYVGRLSPEKDLELWFAVAGLIRKRVPNAQFVVAGDGPERQKLAAMASDFDGSLEMLGAVAYSDLPTVYARANVLLLTSAYEGMGRVVVEAMLAGVPVVSTPTLGPSELIDDGSTGRIVNSREPAALAEAVIALLEYPALARQLAEGGRDWAKKAYRFETIAARLVDSWERAAEIPRRMA